MHRRASPEEVKALLDEEGYAYVDVRSTVEFERGHVPGAFSCPLLDLVPSLGGMVRNPDFLAVMEANFPRDSKIVLGCAWGKRSAAACEILACAGYTRLVDDKAGIDGTKDAFGRTVEPGWLARGYPVTTAADPRRTYGALLRRLR